MDYQQLLTLLTEEEREELQKHVREYQVTHASLLLHMIMEGWQINKIINNDEYDAGGWLDDLATIQLALQYFVSIGIRVGVEVVFSALKTELLPFPTSWKNPIFRGFFHTCSADDECEPLTWLKDIILPIVTQVVLAD